MSEVVWGSERTKLDTTKEDIAYVRGQLARKPFVKTEETFILFVGRLGGFVAAVARLGYRTGMRFTARARFTFFGTIGIQISKYSGTDVERDDTRERAATAIQKIVRGRRARRIRAQAVFGEESGPTGRPGSIAGGEKRAVSPSSVCQSEEKRPRVDSSGRGSESGEVAKSRDTSATPVEESGDSSR